MRIEYHKERYPPIPLLCIVAKHLELLTIWTSEFSTAVQATSLMDDSLCDVDNGRLLLPCYYKKKKGGTVVDSLVH